MGDVADELDLNDPPFPLTAIDREILATKDEDYHRTTWEDLKRIIGMSACCVGQSYSN
jgi:hypothetical protein